MHMMAKKKTEPMSPPGPCTVVWPSTWLTSRTKVVSEVTASSEKASARAELPGRGRIVWPSVGKRKSMSDLIRTAFAGSVVSWRSPVDDHPRERNREGGIHGNLLNGCAQRTHSVRRPANQP